jgi:hypothetical protein
MYTYLPFGAVDVLLNPKNEIVTSNPGEVNVEGGVAATVPPPQSGEVNVEGGVAATVPPPQSVVKEEDEIRVTAVPLSQPAIKEENEKLTAAVSLSQLVVKEDQKLAATAPVSLIAVKKEHNKPVVTVPCFQSAAKEDEKPVASAVPPPSASRENIPKRTQNASSGERSPKKLKSAQETVQNMAPAVPDKKPFELTSRQAVIFLNFQLSNAAAISNLLFSSSFSFNVLGEL